jgi:hypothetical protein
MFLRFGLILGQVGLVGFLGKSPIFRPQLVPRTSMRTC